MGPSRFDPRRLVAIYAGGVLGALARVGLAEAAPHAATSWPWATFSVNLLGALLIGLFVATMRGHRAESSGFAFLTTGLCGTLTTFATFQLELFEMIDAGSAGLALAYATASLAAGYLLVRLGISLGSGAVALAGGDEAPNGRER